MSARKATGHCPVCGDDVAENGRVCLHDGTPFPPASNDVGGSWVGAVIDGRYRVVADGGRGGMSHVYRAIHLALEQPVALKVLLHAPDDAAIRSAFLREARTTAALHHPNIVTIFDFGVWRGRQFLVMPWVEGGSLASWLRSDGPGLRARLRLLDDVLAALEAAHEAGVVHRDVKPSNVLIDCVGRECRGLLADFGLALLEPSLLEPSPLTLVGTPLYMAPEQLMARPASPESDVYAVGCIAYALLTGRPPHAAERLADVVQARLRLDPPPLSQQSRFDLPDGLDAVIARAVARPRLDRWPTGGALREALRPFLDLAEDAPARTEPGLACSTFALEQTMPAPVEGEAGGNGRGRPASAPSLALAGRPGSDVVLAPLSPTLAWSLLAWVEDALLPTAGGRRSLARELLGSLAVFGRRAIPAAVVARFLDILGWAADSRRDAMADAVAARLLTCSVDRRGERLSFTRELLREALETVLHARPEQLRRLHRAAAEAWHDVGPADESGTAARVGAHLAEAGDGEGAGDAYARAAEFARESGAPERARAFLEGGLARLAGAEGPARLARGRLHAALAALVMADGELDGVRSHAERAIADLVTGPDIQGLVRASHLLRAGARESGDVELAIVTLRAVAGRLMEADDPRAAASVLIDAGGLRLSTGDEARARAILTEAASLLEGDSGEGAKSGTAHELLDRLSGALA